MRPLLRTWAASLIVFLPILAVLLVPQLMRSRAGSESLLVVGTALLVGLIAAALVLAPAVSGRVAPPEPAWTSRTAIRSTARVWRRDRRGALLALAIFLAVYALAQAIGLGIAEPLPYVEDNPEFTEGGSEPRWTILYAQYLVQAIAIYVLVALALAAYAERMRRLATRPAQP